MSGEKKAGHWRMTKSIIMHKMKINDNQYNALRLDTLTACRDYLLEDWICRTAANKHHARQVAKASGLMAKWVAVLSQHAQLPVHDFWPVWLSHVNKQVPPDSRPKQIKALPEEEMEDIMPELTAANLGTLQASIPDEDTEALSNHVEQELDSQDNPFCVKLWQVEFIIDMAKIDTDSKAMRVSLISAIDKEDVERLGIQDSSDVSVRHIKLGLLQDMVASTALKKYKQNIDFDHGWRLVYHGDDGTIDDVQLQYELERIFQTWLMQYGQGNRKSFGRLSCSLQVQPDDVRKLHSPLPDSDSCPTKRAQQPRNDSIGSEPVRLAKPKVKHMSTKSRRQKYRMLEVEDE